MAAQRSDSTVDVVGLSDLARELRALDKEWVKELREGSKDVSELVVPKARSELSKHGPVARKAAPTIRAAADQRRAKIRIGSAKIPFGWGAEFGSKLFKQFQPWRGNQHMEGVDPRSNQVGYGIYPAIRNSTEEIETAMGDMIDKITSKAFPD